MENNLKNQLTPEESLSIISASLEKSRKDTLENAGAPMIRWGIHLLVFSLVIFYLWNRTGNPSWNMLWFLMVVVGFAGDKLLDKKRKGVRSFVSATMAKVWGTLGIFAVSASTVTPACLLGVCAILPDSLVPAHFVMPVTLLIVVLLGFAITLTGWILKNGWILAAGLVTGILGTAFSVVLTPEPHQALILTGVSVVGLILPGLLINKKGNGDE